MIGKTTRSTHSVKPGAYDLQIENFESMASGDLTNGHTHKPLYTENFHFAVTWFRPLCEQKLAAPS